MIIRMVLFLYLMLIPSTVHAAQSVSIGCVLPLSGKFASFGNKALQGVELAIEKYNSSDAGKQTAVRLIIKDSRGLPDGAEKAVRELDREGVSLIIGPILSVTAEAAARAAQERGIPIITMTQKEGVTEIGDQVFRNCITSSAQIKALMQYTESSGIKKVAILYPDNSYGKEMSSLFTSELVKTGGQVIFSQAYREDQTDFGPEIKAMVGQDFLKNMKRYNEEKEREFKESEKSGTRPQIPRTKEIERPLPGFDAVFIPDYPERVGLILPQLAFYDIKGVKFLGTSAWDSPRLLNMAGDFMSDVTFVDGFFAGSLRPHVRAFVDLYRNTFGYAPGILEAQAYDTTGIVLSLIAGGNSSRYALKNGIMNIKNYPGVSGNITFIERNAERRFYFLTVRYGSIEEMVIQ